MNWWSLPRPLLRVGGEGSASRRGGRSPAKTGFHRPCPCPSRSGALALCPEAQAPGGPALQEPGVHVVGLSHSPGSQPWPPSGVRAPSPRFRPPRTNENVNDLPIVPRYWATASSLRLELIFFFFWESSNYLVNSIIILHSEFFFLF